MIFLCFTAKTETLFYSVHSGFLVDEKHYCGE